MALSLAEDTIYLPDSSRNQFFGNPSASEELLTAVDKEAPMVHFELPLAAGKFPLSVPLKLIVDFVKKH